MKKTSTGQASPEKGTRGQLTVRVPDLLRTRMENAAVRENKTTLHALIIDAVGIYVQESEDRETERKERRDRGKEKTPSKERVSGLGLRKRMIENSSESPFTEEPVEEAPAPAAPPAQQIVITQAAPAPAVPELDRLAIFVVQGGPPHEEARRLSSTIDILRATARDDTERSSLAKTLDEKIALLKGVPAKKSFSPLDMIGSLFE